MSTRKPPPKKPAKAPVKKSLFQRMQSAMNPATYIKPAAQRQMQNANEQYGGGARRRRIDAEVDAAVDGRPPRRKR